MGFWLGGRLREVVAYKRWSLTGRITNSNLTDGGTTVIGILVRWSLRKVPLHTTLGRDEKNACVFLKPKVTDTLNLSLTWK